MESGKSSEQAISLPSESSVYPDFKAFHMPQIDDCLAAKEKSY
jgi:hypothetical protein